MSLATIAYIALLILGIYAYKNRKFVPYHFRVITGIVCLGSALSSFIFFPVDPLILLAIAVVYSAVGNFLFSED